MDADVSKIIQNYKNLACVPSLSSALLKISPGKDIINVFSTWTSPDLVKSESTKFIREFYLQLKSERLTPLSKGFPSDISSTSFYAFTKSGQRYAAIQKAKKSEESVFLEVWNSTQKEYTFDMTDRKEHGKIHDNNFQSLEWSANEKYLLYIAEAKQKKSESFFKDLFFQKPDQKLSEEVTKGEEYVYQESWGESYTNVHHTVLCILDIESGKVDIVNLDETFPGVSVTQATWGPNDKYIIFVGFKEVPYHLGLVYCSNRSSSIFSYNLETKEVECLTPEENICVEYPVFSPNFETFVYLQNKAGGPHKSCCKLMKYDWKKKEISTIIDIVENANGEEFAGIYSLKLSSRWWSKDSCFYFFHTFRRSFMEIFYVNIFSRKIQKLNIEKSFGTCVLHDVQEPYIVISVSSPNVIPHLMIGFLSKNGDRIHATWSHVEEGLCTEVKDISWSVRTVSPTLINKTYSNLDYDIVVVSSNEKKNGTLILFPHGGPHSVFFIDYFVYAAAFARLGYIICKVNYRGSTGFGENSIKSLLGNIGTQDVSDVVDAVEFLKKDETLGIRDVVGLGGSHGGFLIAHLLGQYPDLLKAACIRNPVIDLTNMESSDIPDWRLIESGCLDVYDPMEVTNPSILKEMWEKSPIRYMKKVMSPTLLCLGKNDLRVPPSQGFQFYRYLKAQNVPVKVYYYDDNHALSKVGTSSDVFVHAALWFQEYSSL